MRRDLKEVRCQRAQERIHTASVRNPEDQLVKLNKLLGDGKGARRERIKLTRRLMREQDELKRADRVFKKKRMNAAPDVLPVINEDGILLTIKKHANVFFELECSHDTLDDIPRKKCY